MANNIIVQYSEEEFKRLLQDVISKSILSLTPVNSEALKKNFNVKEAADYLNLAPQTLYGFTSNRTIPFIKRGKKLYFQKSDLDKWLAEGRKLTKSELGATLTKSLANESEVISISRSINKNKKR